MFTWMFKSFSTFVHWQHAHSSSVGGVGPRAYFLFVCGAEVTTSQHTPFPRLPRGWPRAEQRVFRWLDETCLPQYVCALWEGWRVKDECVYQCEWVYYALSSSRWHTSNSKPHTSSCSGVAEWYLWVSDAVYSTCHRKGERVRMSWNITKGEGGSEISFFK